MKCRRNATWVTSMWSLQGSGILHNASACHVTGQDFQLYPAIEGHSESTIEYHDDVRALHIEPITHKEVQILQGCSHPDVSKLEGIAATLKLFKHRELDATLVVHATERKHDDRLSFLLVLHYSYLGCYPSDNYDMQQLPIFIQKPLTQNPLYHTTCRKFHNWK